MQRAADAVRGAGLCLQLRLLTVCQYCQVSPSEALKKEKHFQITDFLLHFLFDLCHCQRGCPVGKFSVGSRRMAVLMYIGAWPDFWLYHDIPASTLFKYIHTYLYMWIYIFPKCLLKHKSCLYKCSSVTHSLISPFITLLHCLWFATFHPAAEGQRQSGEGRKSILDLALQ